MHPHSRRGEEGAKFGLLLSDFYNRGSLTRTGCFVPSVSVNRTAAILANSLKHAVCTIFPGHLKDTTAHRPTKKQNGGINNQQMIFCRHKSECSRKQNG